MDLYPDAPIHSGKSRRLGGIILLKEKGLAKNDKNGANRGGLKQRRTSHTISRSLSEERNRPKGTGHILKNICEARGGGSLRSKKTNRRRFENRLRL